MVGVLFALGVLAGWYLVSGLAIGTWFWLTARFALTKEDREELELAAQEYGGLGRAAAETGLVWPKFLIYVVRNWKTGSDDSDE